MRLSRVQQMHHVIPAKAGIQKLVTAALDPRLRGGDGMGETKAK
jgi:hypothetical protein